MVTVDPLFTYKRTEQEVQKKEVQKFRSISEGSTSSVQKYRRRKKEDVISQRRESNKRRAPRIWYLYYGNPFSSTLYLLISQWQKEELGHHETISWRKGVGSYRAHTMTSLGGLHGTVLQLGGRVAFMDTQWSLNGLSMVSPLTLIWGTSMVSWLMSATWQQYTNAASESSTIVNNRLQSSKSIQWRTPWTTTQKREWTNSTDSCTHELHHVTSWYRLWTIGEESMEREDYTRSQSPDQSTVNMEHS